jgi:glycosyltransferase involved in cell wall biosynthesis
MASFVIAAWHRLPEVVRSTSAEGIICFFTLPCGPVAWKAWNSTRVPYVISLRGGDVPGLTPSVQWMHWLLRPLRRAILRTATAVIANSPGLQQLSRASDPIPVMVIPNGVNADKFRPGAQSDEQTPFRVLGVGRLHPQKNVAFALNVIDAARKSMSRQLEYHIVGDGPLREELERLVRRLGLERNVFWHGWMDRDQLAAFYRSCDCLLHPALYEGLPNAVLEAMAAGVPVIASDIPGNSDLIADNETGYLCPLGDEHAFSTLLIRLAGDSELCRRLGRSARRLVESGYSWDMVAARYVAIFEGGWSASKMSVPVAPTAVS